MVTANLAALRSLQLWRRGCSGLLTAAVLSWLCSFSGVAKSQDGSEDRTEHPAPATSPDYDGVLDRAMAAFEAQNYASARELFEKAYAIRPNARVLRGLGICALHLERFTLAKRELTQALDESRQPLTLNQREGVEELLSWMQHNLGTLRLRLQPTDARVLVDDRQFSEREIIVKPGARRVYVNADGFVAQDQTIQIDAGEEKTLHVTLSRGPSRSPITAVSSEPSSLMTSLYIGAAGASLRASTPESEPAARVDSPTVFERWWFWAVAGAVIAGGIATTVALTSGESGKTYETGGLGGVLRPLERAP